MDLLAVFGLLLLVQLLLMFVVVSMYMDLLAVFALLLLLVQLLLMFLVVSLYKRMMYLEQWDEWLRELWNNRHHRGRYKREE